MLCGPSGCGKSTFAQKIVNELEHTLIVSTDFIRFYMFGDASVQLFPQRVFNEAYRQIECYLKEGYTVIFDATNLRPRDRKKVLEIVNKCNVETKKCIYFSTPLEECIKNQDKRDRKVNESVIKRQYNSFVVPTEAEGWDAILNYDM